MRARMITTAVALLAASGSLSAQERSTAQGRSLFEPRSDSAVVESRGMLLPAALVPPSSTVAPAGEITAFQDRPVLVPYLFGIFGGIAGMFVGDWWADRECGSDCGAGKIAMLFLAGGLGAITGWVIGGGEIPQPPPERWP